MSNENHQDVFIRQVSKHFGKVRAVDEVTFRIKGGEFLTLLGPSGSGKTTLLNMIAGFFKPTSGEILIGERDITSLPPEKRDVGLTFQNYALFPHMTVFENIAFPLRMRKFSRDDIAGRVKNVLELVRLEGFETRYPKQLSGGQQQRISLARSIVFNPSILLMDEPLGALDKKLRKHMQIELKQLHRKLGMTVVYVTHDQEEALTMSDRIAVVNEGKIAQIGTPDEIYQRPASSFVADFIGESNFIVAEVAEIKEDSASVECRGSRITVPRAGWLEKRQTVRVLLRPERIDIYSDAPQDRRNVFKGIVQDDLYIGNLSRYLIEVPMWNIVINVELRNAQDTVRFRTGQNVFISWRVVDTILVSK